MAQQDLPDQRAVDELLESLKAKYYIHPDRVEFPDEHLSGRGGFGEVSRAILHPEDESPRSPGISSCKDTPGHRKVAVKKLTSLDRVDPQRMKRMFAREVHVWSAARHPNIIAFVGFHFDVTGRVAWLISNWEPFGNIKEYIESRDANVLVTGDIRAVMCDFGLARIIEDEGFQAVQTPTSTIQWSLRWCSLELFAGERTSPESDMWAWGWLVWEVCTGKLPYPNEPNEVAVCGAILTRRLPGPTGEPIFTEAPRLWKFATKCWHKDPASRPTAEEGSQTLKKLFDVMQSAPVGGSVLYIKQPRAQRWLRSFLGKRSGSPVSDEFDSPIIGDKSLARTQSRRPPAAAPMPYVRRAPEAPIKRMNAAASLSRETFDPNASPSGPRTSEPQFLQQRSPSPNPAPTVQSGSYIQKGILRKEPPQPLTVPSSGGGLANTLLTHIFPSPHFDPPAPSSSKKPISPPYDQVSDLSGKLIKLRDKPTKAGGFADVWEGTLLTTGEKVAIKSLRAVDVGYASPQSNEVTIRLDKRLKREMLVWKPLDHKRITNCLGFAHVDGMPSLISLWCKNGNAREYVLKNPDCNKGAMVVQVAEGLGYLHTREYVIVHCDVKWSNVLINDDGEAMLTDCGLVKITDEAMSTFSARYGPPRLFDSPPEVILGQDRSTKSDVYSFACFVLEILTGKPPFYEMGKNSFKIIMGKLDGQKPNPKLYPELPESDPLWLLLNRCWNLGPENRPTMPEVLAELHSLGYRA